MLPALILSLLSLSPTPTSDWEEIPLDLPEWRTNAGTCELVDHLDRAALRLQGGKRWLPDVGFESGVLEIDLAFGPERGFGGAAWHLEDESNHEYFYVRPHQSGNPDACQYTPVDHGQAAWQLFHGPGYGGPIPFRYHEWTTVRIVVAGSRAEIFVGSDEPVVRVRELHREPGGHGGIGLVASGFAPLHVSRVRFKRDDSPPLSRAAPPAPKPPAGAISGFAVSEAFSEALVAERVDLVDLEPAPADLSWTPLAAEPSGIVNLARVQGAAPGADTVFGRVVLEAESARAATLRFGYSDRVRVFLNGRLLYTGDNGYQSRDYRYLGTIGLFDALALDLEPGPNELLFAVSESFGGWGLMAALPDRTGVRVLE